MRDGRRTQAAAKVKESWWSKLTGPEKRQITGSAQPVTIVNGKVIANTHARHR